MPAVALFRQDQLETAYAGLLLSPNRPRPYYRLLAQRLRELPPDALAHNRLPNPIKVLYSIRSLL
ncbi:hypothetical protein [Herpetosiphon giganteus]|uniref:hypothetical protein n=1 Tax=Herpetosiphon giganteus TaxID=2029754 RepID=UPI00195AB21C|nr:hypothetical protein [Herpetosiphon giganteus]MBM7843244.1 hypothetical protein [Herpetosiphon giganteus]